MVETNRLKYLLINWSWILSIWTLEFLGGLTKLCEYIWSNNYFNFTTWNPFLVLLIVIKEAKHSNKQILFDRVGNVITTLPMLCCIYVVLKAKMLVIIIKIIFDYSNWTSVLSWGFIDSFQMPDKPRVSWTYYLSANRSWCAKGGFNLWFFLQKGKGQCIDFSFKHYMKWNSNCHATKTG